MEPATPSPLVTEIAVPMIIRLDTTKTKPVRGVLEITRLISVFEVTSSAEILSEASLGRPVTAMEFAPCP